MPNFEHICEDCPIRTKVDVDRVGQSSSMGTDGYRITLSDGSHYSYVTLENRPVNDSRIANSLKSELEKEIAACEGPEPSLLHLRKRCSVGLASAWRNAEILGAMQLEPNVQSASEIENFLLPADWHDAMPPNLGSGYYVGGMEQFSEYRNLSNSVFLSYGIKKLSQSIKGESTFLPKGQAIMLDRAVYATDKKVNMNWYRLRIAQGGPRFIFTLPQEEDVNFHNREDYGEIINKLTAEGIYRYINSDKDAVRWSNEKEYELEESGRQAREAAIEWLKKRP